MLPAYRIVAGDAIAVALPHRAGYGDAMSRGALLSVLLLAFGLPGCFSPPARPPDPIHFAPDTETMRREILRHVPFGMPLKQARGIMEANGFRCDNNRRSRVMTCENTSVAPPVRAWLFYDPEDTIKDVQARCGD